MKKKLISCVVISTMLLSACSTSSKNTLAYGAKFDINEFLNLEKEETADIPVSVDTKIVGTYLLKGSVKKEDKKTRTVDEKIIVEDKEKAVIKTVQETDKTYEIPLNDNYQVLGNIDKISDKVDGEYTEVQIVGDKEYKEIKKKVEALKKEVNKQSFKSNEEVEKYKSSKEKAGYSLVTHNVDTSKAGTYAIHVLSIDMSFNTSEISYRVNVLEKDKKADKKKLAAGATGSKLGKATGYQIADKTAKEVVNEPEKEEISEEAGSEEVQNFDNNIVSSNEVSSQGSPVLQAALAMVGGHMSCDALATMALVNGGMITGTPNAIFVSGSIYNIGVYQMPAIMQSISASQAVPGDLIYYDNGGYGSAHIAVYAGNGKAVHGGWYGRDVVVSTVNIGSGPRYMRFSPMTWDAVFKGIFGYDANDFNSGGSAQPPTDEGGSGDAIGGDQPSFDDPSYGDITTTYSAQAMYNGVIIAISSATPIDQEYLSGQVQSYANGEITYEQAVANLQAKGYTIIDPF